MSTNTVQKTTSKKGLSEAEKKLIDKLDPNTKALWTLIDIRFNFFEEVADKQNKRLSVLESKMKKVEKTLDSKEVNFFREMNERRFKEKNVIIFNFTDSQNAKNTDLQKIKNLLGNSSVSDEIPFDLHMITVRRLGKTYKKDTTRPLLMSLSSPDDVNWLFKNKKEIFTGNTFIANDQTKSQQEYYKKLKKEVDARNESGDGKFGIRYFHKVPEIVEIKESQE